MSLAVPVRRKDATMPGRPPGLRRSAQLMRALGARAAAVWSSLTPDEAQALSAAMRDLPEDQAEEDRALDQYVQDMSTTLKTPAVSSGSIWTQLSARDGNATAALIQSESPQVIAVILSRLQAEAAAATVKALPKSLATQVLKRLLVLGEVQPKALSAIEATLSRNLTHRSQAHGIGGAERVARIFDSLGGRAEQDLLSSLDEAAPGAAEKIRALMFTFEDLASLDPASLQTILANTDRAVLTLALKGAGDAVSAAFFANMTQRAGELLRAEIEAAGPVRRSDIEAARQDILAMARTLVKRGDILGDETDDELVE